MKCHSNYLVLLQVVFEPAEYIMRPMEEKVENIPIYPEGESGLLGAAFGKSKRLISKLNKSLMIKSKSGVDTEVTAGLNARIIKVGFETRCVRYVHGVTHSTALEHPNGKCKQESNMYDLLAAFALKYTWEQLQGDRLSLVYLAQVIPRPLGMLQLRLWV
jgi:hypothetical protein